MSNGNKQPTMYEIATRAGGIVLAVGLWAISIKFSVDGFRITSNEAAWIGTILGFTVTYLQIIFNHGVKTETLRYAGILAYIYGVSTNLVGILAARQTNFTMQWLQEDPAAFLLQMIIVLMIALVIEILPEHLLLVSLYPEEEMADFVKELRGKTQGQFRGGNQQSRRSRRNKNKGGQQQQQGGQPNQQNQNRPRENQQNRVNQPQFPQQRNNDIRAGINNLLNDSNRNRRRQ